MEIGHKAVLIMIALVFIFPFFYLFIPIYIAFVINAILIIISVYISWKREERLLVIVALIFFVLNTYFLIKYISTLELLSQTLTLDPVEYIRAASFGVVVSRFIEYLPFFLLFLGAFGVLYAWSFIATRGGSTYQFAILLGYVGSALVLVLIFIDMFIFSPAENIEELGFEIMIGQNPVLIPFELYYFAQISVWYLSTFTFIVTLLGHISGGTED